MAATSRDIAATAAQHFVDKRSKVCISGAWHLHGQDARDAYDKAYKDWNAAGRLCGRCGFFVAKEDEDWEHVKAKSKGRDDHPRNRRFSHGMFSRHPCHRNEHNREIRWSKKHE